MQNIDVKTGFCLKDKDYNTPKISKTCFRDRIKKQLFRCGKEAYFYIE